LKTVVVTGAAGFLGSHLCERYLGDGYRVIGVDNFCTGQKQNIEILKKSFQSGFLFFSEDVVQPWGWLEKVPQDWLTDLKFIFHFASPASPKFFKLLSIETIWANTLGLENCLQVADRYKAKVIFASTSEIYGNPLQHPQNENYFGNVNSFGARACYNESKRLGEALIYSHNKKFETRHGLVRIFNTYGPRMSLSDGRVVVNFLKEALSTSQVHVYGNGQQTRSFCYVDDLIEGVVRYAAADVDEPVNIGCDEEISINQLVEELQKCLAPHRIEVVHGPLPEEDPFQRRPDLTKAKKLLADWKPKVSLGTGLQKMAHWIKTLDISNLAE